MAPLPLLTAGITLRPGHPDDASALDRLAALDSQALPPGPFLLATETASLRAALCLTTGATLADPFAPTAHLLPLLRRAAQGRAARLPLGG